MGRHAWFYSATWERRTARHYVGKHRAGPTVVVELVADTSQYVKATDRVRALLARMGGA